MDSSAKFHDDGSDPSWTLRGHGNGRIDERPISMIMAELPLGLSLILGRRAALLFTPAADDVRLVSHAVLFVDVFSFRFIEELLAYVLGHLEVNPFHLVIMRHLDVSTVRIEERSPGPDNRRTFIATHILTKTLIELKGQSTSVRIHTYKELPRLDSDGFRA